MPATLNLYLIRHGQTEYNAAGIVQGWCDSPLTVEGKAGAAQTGNAIAQAQIPIAAAYCSTSPHCRHRPNHPTTRPAAPSRAHPIRRPARIPLRLI